MRSSRWPGDLGRGRNDRVGLPGRDDFDFVWNAALKVRGKLLTRLRREDDSLVLLDVPVEEREMLIAAEPRIFHTTPHYEGYPTVLVHLSVIEAATVRAFLERRWRNIASKRAVFSFDKRE